MPWRPDRIATEDLEPQNKLDRFMFLINRTQRYIRGDLANGSDVTSAIRPVVKPVGALTRRAAIHRRKAARAIAKAPPAAKTLAARRLRARQKQCDIAIRKRLIRRQGVLAKAELLLLFGNLQSLLHDAHNMPRTHIVRCFKGQTASAHGHNLHRPKHHARATNAFT